MHEPRWVERHNRDIDGGIKGNGWAACLALEVFPVDQLQTQSVATVAGFHEADKRIRANHGSLLLALVVAIGHAPNLVSAWQDCQHQAVAIEELAQLAIVWRGTAAVCVGKRIDGYAISCRYDFEKNRIIPTI